MKEIKSIHNVTIRFTEERWFHIVENHDDLAGYFDEIIDTIEFPEYIISGYNDAKIALKSIKQGKYIAVVYKEVTKDDGFVITAYFTSKLKLENEVILWERH
jgi:hypothetical protein